MAGGLAEKLLSQILFHDEQVMFAYRRGIEFSLDPEWALDIMARNIPYHVHSNVAAQRQLSGTRRLFEFGASVECG